MQNFPKPSKADTGSGKKIPVYNPFEEPSQIVKAAGEQLSGVRVKPEMEIQQPLEKKREIVPEEIVEAKSRARLRELREEISQVTEEREKQETISQQEEYAKKQQEGGAISTQPAPEPQGKRPRGMLKGFAGFLKRKQTHTEFGKNPAQ